MTILTEAERPFDKVKYPFMILKISQQAKNKMSDKG